MSSSPVAVLRGIVLAAAMAAATGCAGEVTTPPPTMTPAATSTPSPSPSAVGTYASASPSGLGWNVPYSSPGTGVSVAIASVGISAVPAYDRIVWELSGDRMPSVTVAIASRPFVHDPSGLPMTVAGSTYLRVVLTGMATSYNGPHDLPATYRVLREVALQGHFEGVSSWIVGLDHVVGVHVQVLTAPLRLVIDVT